MTLDWPQDEPSQRQMVEGAIAEGCSSDPARVCRLRLVLRRAGSLHQIVFGRVDVCRPEDFPKGPGHSFGELRTIAVDIDPSALIRMLQGLSEPNSIGGLNVASIGPAPAWHHLAPVPRVDHSTSWPARRLSRDLPRVPETRPGPLAEHDGGGFFKDFFALAEHVSQYEPFRNSSDARLHQLIIYIWDHRGRISSAELASDRATVQIEGDLDRLRVQGQFDLAGGRAVQISERAQATVTLAPPEKTAGLALALVHDTGDVVDALEKHAVPSDRSAAGRKSPAPDLENKRFRDHVEIGAGDVGVVYDAFDTKLNRHVALKYVPQPVHRSKDALAHARALAQFEHRNIVRIYDVLENEPQPEADVSCDVVVLELVKGQTIEARGTSKTPLSTRMVRRAVLNMLSAFDFLQSRNTAHGDLHEGNVLVDVDGTAMVLDIAHDALTSRSTASLARRLESDQDRLARLIAILLNKAGLDADRFLREGYRRDLASLRAAAASVLDDGTLAPDGVEKEQGPSPSYAATQEPNYTPYETAIWDCLIRITDEQDGSNIIKGSALTTAIEGATVDGLRDAASILESDGLVRLQGYAGGDFSVRLTALGCHERAGDLLGIRVNELEREILASVVSAGPSSSSALRDRIGAKESHIIMALDYLESLELVSIMRTSGRGYRHVQCTPKGRKAMR